LSSVGILDGLDDEAMALLEESSFTTFEFVPVLVASCLVLELGDGSDISEADLGLLDEVAKVAELNVHGVRPPFATVEGGAVAGQVDEDVDVCTTVGVIMNRESREPPTIDRFSEHGIPRLVAHIDGPEMQGVMDVVVRVLEHVDNGEIHIDMVENDTLSTIDMGDGTIMLHGPRVWKGLGETVVIRDGTDIGKIWALELLEQDEEGAEMRIG